MPAPARQPTFIRAWRLARDISLEELAAAVGMAGGNLSKIERGLTPYTQDGLERIAGVLKVTPAELLARPPDQRRELWMILAGARPELRDHILEVAEKMAAFRPAQPLDELLPALVTSAPARLRRVRRAG